MDLDTKIRSLKSQILDSIGLLVSSKCILTDLPYHNNIGDILIWRGEIDLIKHLNVKLLHTSSSFTFPFNEIDPDTTILLHGGGNFGDLYPSFHNFKKEIIKKYPNNRIIILPQSVWYENHDLIEEDARFFASHKDLYLCARDRSSYDFMKKNFPLNNILLVPDMAFFIDENILKRYRGKNNNKKLFLRRLDKEITDSTPLKISETCDIRDWPTIEKKPIIIHCFDRAYGLARRIKRFSHLYQLFNKFIDTMADIFIKDRLVKIGCEFLSQYSQITTTRLHTLILSVLLHKSVEYIDNSTKKLSSFANTWLREVPSVNRYEE